MTPNMAFFGGMKSPNPPRNLSFSRPRHHLPAMRWLETRWEIAPEGGGFCVSGHNRTKPGGLNLGYVLHSYFCRCWHAMLIDGVDGLMELMD